MTDDKAGLTISPRMYRLAARARGASQRVGVPLLFGGLTLSWITPDLLPRGVYAALVLVGVAALMLGMPLLLARIDAPLLPQQIQPPARGRWSVINSPTSAVPSHGTNGYGQTYAFDLIFDPRDGGHPQSRGLGFDAPARFPAFGQPVLAPVDGVVAGVRSRGRDHRCRARWPALAFLYLEGFVRELLGVRFVIGNYVVIDAGDGKYALCGHLQRGSVEVDVGDHVRASDVIGRCGNSGNSSEPHIHMQVMDHPKPLYAAGLPVVLPTFANADRPTGIPANGEHLDTDEATDRLPGGGGRSMAADLA